MKGKVFPNIVLNKVHAYNKGLTFKGKKRIINYFLDIADIAAMIIVLLLALAIVNHDFTNFFSPLYELGMVILLMIPLWVILFKATNASRPPRTSSYLNIFFDFVNFSLLNFIALSLVVLLFGVKEISLLTIVLFMVLGHLVLYTTRIATFKVFKYYRANGHNSRHVVIIADAFSEPIIQKIIENKEWGFRIRMIVSDSKLIRAKFGSQIKIVPDKANLRSLMDIDIVDEVIYCKHKISHDLEKLIKSCQEVGVTFRLQSDFSPIALAGADVTHVENIPFQTYINNHANSFGFVWKSITDILFSSTAMILLSPVLVGIAIAIKLTSKGPVIFKQARVGLRGRQFYLYKFRTMVANAEELKKKLEALNEADGPAFKIKNDPRITKIGRILRKTGLDELPQLYNVVRGEMSLIGPRPPLPDEVKKYERWQLRRLSVKPGITCTWQIIPNRNDVLFENWMKLDLQYIDNWSIRSDFMLILKTIKTVFLGTGS